MKKLLYMLTVVLVLTGCNSQNEYATYTKEYNTIYYELTNLVIIEDTEQTLQNIYDAKEEISNLALLIENVKDSVPERKLDDYKLSIEKYNDLCTLLNSYNIWDSLDPYEQGEVWYIIGYMSMEKEDYNEKK